MQAALTVGWKGDVSLFMHKLWKRKNLKAEFFEFTAPRCHQSILRSAMKHISKVRPLNNYRRSHQSLDGTKQLLKVLLISEQRCYQTVVHVPPICSKQFELPCVHIPRCYYTVTQVFQGATYQFKDNRLVVPWITIWLKHTKLFGDTLQNWLTAPCKTD